MTKKLIEIEAEASCALDGDTQYLDENGKLVNPLEGEELEKWKALPMNAPLEKGEIK